MEPMFIIAIAFFILIAVLLLGHHNAKIAAVDAKIEALFGIANKPAAPPIVITVPTPSVPPADPSTTTDA